MGLDLHVMPLSKFMTGDFVSPLEQFLGGGKVKRLGSAKPGMSKDEALAYVAQIQAFVRPLTRDDATWNEDAESAFTEQYDYDAFTLLGAFAANLEYPRTKGFWRREILPFSEKEAPENHPGYVRVRSNRAESKFRHLICHAANQGFYLPVDYPTPIEVYDDPWIMAGSSPRLLNELDRLAAPLGMTRDWTQLEKGEGAASAEDPLGSVKFGWSVLRAAARVSVERRLPIVFDG